MLLALSVTERLLLLNSLPRATGERSFLRAVLSFREALVISDEEAKDIGLTQAPGKLNWDVQREAPKEIEVGAAVAAFIAETLNALSAQSVLPEQLLRLLDQLDPIEAS